MLKSKRLFLISIFTILISMAMLISVTFAWFTSTTSTKVPSVKSATYDLVASYKINETDTLTTIDNYSYTMTSNTCTITLSVASTSTASTGYCVVNINDNVGSDDYYTTAITGNTNYTFKINASSGIVITLTPKWGSYDQNGKTIINNGDTLPNDPSNISGAILDLDELVENKTVTTNEIQQVETGTTQAGNIDGEQVVTGEANTSTPEQNNAETQTGTQETETSGTESTTNTGNNNNGESISETGETDASTEKVEETVDNVDTSTADNTQEVNQ